MTPTVRVLWDLSADRTAVACTWPSVVDTGTSSVYLTTSVTVSVKGTAAVVASGAVGPRSVASLPTGGVAAVSMQPGRGVVPSSALQSLAGNVSDAAQQLLCTVTVTDLAGLQWANTSAPLLLEEALPCAVLAPGGAALAAQASQFTAGGASWRGAAADMDAGVGVLGEVELVPASPACYNRLLGMVPAEAANGSTAPLQVTAVGCMVPAARLDGQLQLRTQVTAAGEWLV
jgi:hypothetical protein